MFKIQKKYVVGQGSKWTIKKTPWSKKDYVKESLSKQRSRQIASRKRIGSFLKDLW